MNANNFGTQLEKNPAIEKPYNDSNGSLSTLNGTMSIDSDGNYFVYVYAFCNTDGSYDWKILNDAATDKVKNLSDKEFRAIDFTEDMILAEGTIPATETGYVKQIQNKLAVYGNIYKYSDLVGRWDFVGTYK